MCKKSHTIAHYPFECFAVCWKVIIVQKPCENFLVTLFLFRFSLREPTRGRPPIRRASAVNNRSAASIQNRAPHMREWAQLGILCS